MMNPIRYLPVLLLLSALLASSATIAAGETVVVGCADSDSFEQWPRKMRSLFVDLLDRVAQSQRWNLEYVSASRAECFRKLDAGEVDLVLAAPHTTDLAERYDFTRETVVSTWAQVYTRPKSGIQSLLDLSGRSIGVVRGDAYEAELRAMVKGLNVNCRVVEFREYRDVLDAIARRWVDAGVVDRIFGFTHGDRRELQPTPIVFAPIELRFASARNQNGRLIAAIDYRLREMKANPHSAYYQLLGEALGETASVEAIKHLKWGLVVAVALVLVAGGVTVVLRWEVKRTSIALSDKSRVLTEEVVKRHSSDRALQEANLVLESIFASLRDGFLIVDVKTGELRRHNRAARDMFCCSTEEFLAGGCSVKRLIDPKDMEQFESGCQKALREGTHSVLECSMQRCDGVAFPAELTLTPLRSARDEQDLCIMVVHDITARIEAEESLRQSEMRLRQAQKLESIGTLAGGVAHEINNPIMGIMNYAQLILDRVGPGNPVSEVATEIGRETQRIATIVKNLLSFARFEKQHQSPARMSDIVEGTLSLIRAVMRHDQVMLEVDVPADLPEIRCRTQQIQQVIMNLLTNARDALNEKYPRHDENKKVLIMARQIEKDGRPWIRTTVEDHGLGIPKNLRERIFDPFFTTKPRDKGTGLGLSISHGIVKDHSGELSVESEIGQWTRFHVDLPTADKTIGG